MTFEFNNASHVVIPVCFRAGIYLLSYICSAIALAYFTSLFGMVRGGATQLSIPNYLKLFYDLEHFSDSSSVIESLNTLPIPQKSDTTL